MDTTTADPSPAKRQSATTAPAPTGAANFFAKYWSWLLAISAAVVAPCLWHEHIEAGDLPSHVYNAWLAHLVQTGQAPGLYIARPWDNILFDVALQQVARAVGLPAAERIVTCAAVLIFFWGAFALVCAVASAANRHAPERATIPWFVLPCLAMIAYGYTFEMGFMNYYISIGLAFFALSLIVRASARGAAGKAAFNLTGAALLAPLIWLAHPLGIVVLIGAGAYILIANRLAQRLQILLFAASALLVVAARFYIAAHFVIAWHAGQHVIEDGTDQLLTYGHHYVAEAYALQLFFWGALLWDAFTRATGADATGEVSAGASGTRATGADRASADSASADTNVAVRGAAETPTREAAEHQSPWWHRYLLPLQLYGLALLAAWLLPAVIRMPRYAAPVGLLTERLTSISAVLLCCLLGVLRPRKWHLAALVAIAAVFFFFLYQDTAKINGMEDQAAHYVRLLPPGQRILTTILPFPGARVFIEHTVDRACIAWCFSYENYEPSSLQFRVRVDPGPGNPMVMSSAVDADAAEGGNYEVQQKDMPAYQIYQCDLTMTKLCMRELSPGEENGAVGLRLNPTAR